MLPSRSDPLRVAVVDDCEIVAAGLSAMLAPYAERLRVVTIDSRRPANGQVDVILMDSFGCAVRTSFSVDQTRVDGRVSVVEFSWSGDGSSEQGDGGSAGHISKELTAAELVEAIERAHAGQVPRSCAGGPARDEEHDDGMDDLPRASFGLTQRESDVLWLICRGLNNAEVADRAGVGVNTVKSHIRTLYGKIDAHSRTQAVLWGMQRGFGPERAGTRSRVSC